MLDCPFECVLCECSVCREGSGSPGTGVPYDSEGCKCWEYNLSLLQEQPELSTPSPGPGLLFLRIVYHYGI